MASATDLAVGIAVSLALTMTSFLSIAIAVSSHARCRKPPVQRTHIGADRGQKQLGAVELE